MTVKKGTSIVSIDNEKVSVVKLLPALATVSAIENRLIDKNIQYKWLLKDEAPKSLLEKLFTPKFLLLLFYGGLGYILLLISGINPFSKDLTALYPEDIKGSFDDLIGYEDVKNECR